MLDGLSLVKWAPIKYHPSCHKTLQIRTLHEYRRAELGDRTDEREGTYSYTVRFPEGTALPLETQNRLSGGKIHWRPDRPILSPPYCLTMNNEFIDFRTGSAVYSMTHDVSNGFILCLSLSDAPDKPLFAGTEPLWSVPVENADALANVLSKSLLERAKAENFAQFERGLSDKRSVDDVEVRCEHGCVEYLPRDFVVDPKQASAGLDELGRRIARSPFIKPVEARYQREKEYRFVFEFDAKGMRMPVKQTCVDVLYDDFIKLVDVLQH